MVVFALRYDCQRRQHNHHLHDVRLLHKPVDYRPSLEHSRFVLRLIVQYFIRSAWVLEGLTQGGEQQRRNDDNLLKLIKFTSNMLKASDCENFYLIQKNEKQA